MTEDKSDGKRKISLVKRIPRFMAALVATGVTSDNVGKQPSGIHKEAQEIFTSAVVDTIIDPTKNNLGFGLTSISHDSYNFGTGSGRTAEKELFYGKTQYIHLNAPNCDSMTLFDILKNVGYEEGKDYFYESDKRSLTFKVLNSNDSARAKIGLVTGLVRSILLYSYPKRFEVVAPISTLEKFLGTKLEIVDQNSTSLTVYCEPSNKEEQNARLNDYTAL